MKPFTSMLALLLIVSGCGAAEAPRKLKVLTSILPAYCLAAGVAGDRAVVENLLPPGVGPHDYSLSVRDRRKFDQADVIILNGLGLESWLDRVIKASANNPKRAVVRLADGVTNLITTVPTLDLGHGHAHEHEHGDANPHIWLDPQLAAHGVTNILRALQQADPANAAAYATNAQALVKRLQTLDAEIARVLASLKDREIVTYHDAFPYFARRYGLKVLGVVETVPEVNPSPKYLSQLSQVIREHRVPVIFTEAGFPTKLAQRLRDELKIAIAPLDTLESGPLQPAAYEEGLRRNLETLKQHLR